MYTIKEAAQNQESPNIRLDFGQKAVFSHLLKEIKIIYDNFPKRIWTGLR